MGSHCLIVLLPSPLLLGLAQYVEYPASHHDNSTVERSMNTYYTLCTVNSISV